MIAILTALLVSCGDETLKTEDGVKIAATYVEAKGKKPKDAPAAILVPMFLDVRGSWKTFADEAGAKGVATIAIDPRGHGASENPSKVSPARWTYDQWKEVLKDIRAAKAFLTGKGHAESRIVVIGASIGALLALEYGIVDKKIAGIGLLSIANELTKRTPKDDIARFDKRPIFIAYSLDDVGYAEVSQEMVKALAGKATVREYKKASHGTIMFGREEPKGDLTVALLEWIGKVAK
jgi:alpha-beta hydrolase superfamily lysophospholipase